VKKIAAVAVLVVVLAAIGWAMLDRPRAANPAVQVSTGTAPVTRGTVTERVRLAGVLGFDGRYPVVHQGAPGILTWAPRPGLVVERGGVVYAVANNPTRLLFGAVPAYRDFAAGMPDGPDVKQLEENLAALRLVPGPVDRRFTATTAAAIRRWQAAWGLSAAQRTGALPLGAVAFAPAALRIDQVPAVVGMTLGPDEPVLSATSTTRVVIAQLPTDRQNVMRAGDRVEVSISGGPAAVPGSVLRIGTVAAAPEDSASDGASNGANLEVTVRVDLPAGGADLDKAPAQVSVTTATRENVLLVPVVALLPRPGGGYQVRLASGEFVPVQPGLFDSGNGTVEVTGSLTVGQLVEVPIP
jgi:peptidoglycan hydrolase-like protein with peptidoglycan-binding domain